MSSSRFPMRNLNLDYHISSYSSDGSCQQWKNYRASFTLNNYLERLSSLQPGRSEMNMHADNWSTKTPAKLGTKVMEWVVHARDRRTQTVMLLGSTAMADRYRRSEASPLWEELRQKILKIHLILVLSVCRIGISPGSGCWPE